MGGKQKRWGTRKWERLLSEGSLGKGDFTKLEGIGANMLLMQNGGMNWMVKAEA